MGNINNTIAGLELAQIGWVIPDIHAAVKFLASALGVAGFPQPAHIRAQDLDMAYYDFDRVTSDLREQGYAIISEVDHPIARMVFFDTYQTLGAATEIMGITPEGWIAIQKMQKNQGGFV